MRRRAAVPGRFARTAAALALLGLSCGERPTARVETGPLPPGIAARVGSVNVRVGTVSRIARAQAISPSAARAQAVSDALFAAAMHDDPAAAASVAAAERSVLARAVLEHLRDAARALGPPTDEEVRTLTLERWVELDRPPSVGTSHVVVLVKQPADDAPARALAEKLAGQLRGAADAAEFAKRAQSEPKGPLEITAESLPPVTPDGRLWDPTALPPKALPGTLDLDFTRAAVALEKPGEQSGVVKSAFGYHVIFLTQRYPELRVPLEERRARLESDVLSRRVKPELEALSTRLRKETPVSTERAAEALTALVAVQP